MIFFLKFQLPVKNSCDFQSPWIVKEEEEVVRNKPPVLSLGGQAPPSPVIQAPLCLSMEWGQSKVCIGYCVGFFFQCNRMNIHIDI